MLGLFRNPAIACAIALTGAGALAAQPLACPGGRVFTENAGAEAGRVCEAAARATEQLETCSLTVPAPVTIAMVDALEDDCLGVYHCGERRIEILSQASYTELRAIGAASAFASISDDAFFEGVIRHELAHAALDDLPCPFGSCLAAQEYVAYTMQVFFLPEADRAAFEATSTVEGRVPRDAISRMILLMAPNVFAQRAFQHLMQREDPCAFIGQVARGEVLLDYEHP
ncbi:hypothetical protein P6F26_15320 [Roseibacterium sp. SDUM158017]|uniref:DUF6639 family protein n=1 Tax=Roseicyclus salinarum TaxID=3036773 RepID=UPI0024154871|nr:DUF6639 family protein [Roseibacterium sp. SDUM158017]MDG4649814.1 hypothetical protein [Roseibacterium sp. SDUM158017]